LYQQLNEVQEQELGNTVIGYLNGYEGVPQDDREATYGCTRIPSDGELNWAWSTTKLHCLVRALVPPFPGAYTFLKGKHLTIWKAEPVENPPNFRGRVPGRVVGISRSKGYADILTGDGVLRIFEVQLQREGRTTATAVITSLRDTLGLRTIELLERIEALEQQVAELRKMQEGAGRYAN
jgi:methionyl-tRNA formyltransferase